MQLERKAKQPTGGPEVRRAFPEQSRGGPERGSENALSIWTRNAMSECLCGDPALRLLSPDRKRIVPAKKRDLRRERRRICHSGIHGTAAPNAVPDVKTAMYTGVMPNLTGMPPSWRRQPLSTFRWKKTGMGTISWSRRMARLWPVLPLTSFIRTPMHGVPKPGWWWRSAWICNFILSPNARSGSMKDSQRTGATDMRMSTSAAPAKTSIRQTGAFRSSWIFRSATKKSSTNRCCRKSILKSIWSSTTTRSNVSPAAESPGKMRGSATMAGSLSPRCSVLNMASRFTSIRPAASLSAEAGFIILTGRIRKTRQESRGLTRRSLQCDDCFALLAGALSSIHSMS